jgi:hypothetical protein
VQDGRQIYRCAHQAETLLAKIQLPCDARVLDYGCAKGATLKAVVDRRGDIVPYLFDVTPTYVHFWEEFCENAHWAIQTPNPDWKQSFDAVTSFFVLEHVTDPRGMLAAIRDLLTEQGVLYGIVPDTYQNVADFVVADHVNHFSAASLTRLLQETGFAVREVDDRVHTGALVFVAHKAESHKAGGAKGKNGTRQVPPGKNLQTHGNGMPIDDVRGLMDRAAGIAAYWTGYSQRVRNFEQAHTGSGRAAIYGAGFYGTWLATCLVHPQRVACFVDQNPFLHGKTHCDRPIVAPQHLPDDVHTVYVGLNPAQARAVIQSIPIWQGRNLEYAFP